eukprot:Pgem_evm1s17004
MKLAVFLITVITISMESIQHNKVQALDMASKITMDWTRVTSKQPIMYPDWMVGKPTTCTGNLNPKVLNYVVQRREALANNIIHSTDDILPKRITTLRAIYFAFRKYPNLYRASAYAQSYIINPIAVTNYRPKHVADYEKDSKIFISYHFNSTQRYVSKKKLTFREKLRKTLVPCGNINIEEDEFKNLGEGVFPGRDVSVYVDKPEGPWVWRNLYSLQNDWGFSWCIDKFPEKYTKEGIVGINGIERYDIFSYDGNPKACPEWYQGNRSYKFLLNVLREQEEQQNLLTTNF